ncbi:COG1361 S-layer family protein [Gudongella sp. DL1XJH-153]|uniref:COG1361 S-layer family protein n=1 Tax=Gudongella sp. DL1XJH-153 TaxID=3409804 RepID=UPI003BB4A66F
MKRLLSSFLAMVMIFTILPATVFATGEGFFDKPDLIMVSPNTFTGEPGKDLELDIRIKNSNGYEDAIDVTATLYSDSSGMVLVDGKSYREENVIKSSDTENFSFDVEINNNAPDNTYSMDLRVVYYDNLGEKYTLSERINIRVIQDDTTPDLIVSRTDVMPNATLNPGDPVVVGFELSNLGEGPARNITIGLPGLSEESLILANGLSIQRIPDISGGRKGYLYFELQASNTIRSGNHEMMVQITYRDTDNNIVESQQYFSFQATKNDERASKLVIENLKYPTGALGQNREVKVTFDIRNQGQSSAKNVEVKATSQDESGLVPKSLGITKTQEIQPGEVQSFQFLFVTTRTGQTRNYPIEVTVDYTDELVEPASRESLTHMIGVFLNAPDENANQSTPKLIIDRYSFSPTLVSAGNQFQMSLSFYNTNNTKTVRNIKIYLTADEETESGSVFTPVNSSNTFYIDSIPPKGKIEKTISMYTVPDAKAKTYTLTANFEYEDSLANPYTAVELIGVPVVQQSKLDSGEVGFFPESYVGQSTPISVEFYNTGKVPLYNMMVKLDGNFQTENGQYYVGNFNSGSSDFFEGYVIPSEAGQLEGEIVFTFEDSTGQKIEERKPFSLNVMDMEPMPEFPMEPPMEDPGAGGSMTRFIIPGLVLLAMVGGIILYRRKKAKKFDEDLEIDE